MPNKAAVKFTIITRVFHSVFVHRDSQRYNIFIFFLRKHMFHVDVHILLSTYTLFIKILITSVTFFTVKIHETNFQIVL